MSASELRGRLARAGLASHADALMEVASSTIRLLSAEEAGADVPVYRHTPVEVPGLGGGAAAVAGGGLHSLALMSDGSVMGWGVNEYGQLGDGTRRDRRVPVGVRDLDGVVAIAVGGSHSLALRSDGSVSAWGRNDCGQLGDGTREHRRAPIAVSGLKGGVTAIAAGNDVSLALRGDGSVVGWGLNAADKIGFDHIPQRPIPIPSLDGGVLAIAAGDTHRLALAADGSVLAWGQRHGRALGAVRVAGLPGRGVAIAAGAVHSLARRSDGSVMAWENDIFDTLGHAGAKGHAAPIRVAGLASGVRAVAAGPGYSFALGADGVPRAWGWNDRGQLGDGTLTHAPSPVRLAGLDAGVSAFAPDVALKNDGSVLSWGERLPRDKAAPGASLPLGATRLGGSPDLPPNTSWPQLEDRPMAFVAQIALADVAPHDERGALPQAGLLSFFCSPADLGREGAGASFFTDPQDALSQAAFPDDLAPHERFSAVRLTPHRELSWLPADSRAMKGLSLSEQERLAYRDVIEEHDGPPMHRMLGHPSLIQSDPRDTDPDLRLLLQVDSDDHAGMEWGDRGHLYFWIDRSDLDAQRFHRCHLEPQSH